jgi:hypothetical protein
LKPRTPKFFSTIWASFGVESQALRISERSIKKCSFNRVPKSELTKMALLRVRTVRIPEATPTKFFQHHLE